MGTMTQALQIDFVSDVACPWCAVGLASLERALEKLGGDVPVEIRFQPFELNPQMPAEGEDLVEHLGRKYGMTPQQCADGAEMLRKRGETVSVVFGDKRSRIYNTFDAHRLLHWAGLEGRQRELKHALLRAYFTDGENPSDHALLVRVAAACGLDAERAKAILAADDYAYEVREREAFYQQHGINAVPSVIIDDRHLIQGGQPAEVFERTLQQLAQETAAGA